MSRYYLLLILLLLGKTASADQLDGLNDLGTIVFLLLIGVISILVLIVSAVRRFTRTEFKVSLPLNFACTVLIGISLIAIVTIGFTDIDPGFLTACLAVILISALLILANYRVGINRKEVD